MKSGIVGRSVLAGVVTVAALAAASSAMADTPSVSVFGPVYPLPGYTIAQSHGGSSCKKTGSIELGTLVWSFGSNPSTTAPETGTSCADTTAPPAFDPSRNQALYWGLDLTSPTGNQVSVGPNVGPNGNHAECTVNTASGPMVLDKTDSTPASGVLIYQGTTDSADQLTLTFRDQNGQPFALTDANTIGTPKNGSFNEQAVGYVAAITQSVTNFSVSASYKVHGSALTAWNPTCGTTSDISGGFYYVDLPPSATIKATPSPVANHTTTTFAVDTATDPYAADDAAAPLTYAWDLSGGTTYSDGTASSVQSSYGPGDHTVALQVTAPDGLSTRVEDPFSITNQAPTGTIAVQSPGTDPPGNHTTTTFVISNLADPDQGTDLTCAAPTVGWDLTGGTNYSSVTGANVGSFGPGQHTVAALLTDCDGGITTVTKTFTITDQAPTGSITPSPNPPKSGQLETFTATNVTDPDQGSCAAPTYGWDMSGGTSYTQFLNANATGTFGPGSYTIALGITDCDGTITRVTYPFTIAPAATLKLAPRQTLHGALSNGFKASLTGNEAFGSQLALTLTSAKSKAGKPIAIKGSLWTGKPALTKSGTVAFTMKLTSAAKTKLAQAKTATFSLKGTAKDKAGHTVPVRLSFTMT